MASDDFRVYSASVALPRDVTPDQLHVAYFGKPAHGEAAIPGLHISSANATRVGAQVQMSVFVHGDPTLLATMDREIIAGGVAALVRQQTLANFGPRAAATVQVLRDDRTAASQRRGLAAADAVTSADPAPSNVTQLPVRRNTGAAAGNGATSGSGRGRGPGPA